LLTKFLEGEARKVKVAVLESGGNVTDVQVFVCWQLLCEVDKLLVMSLFKL
jgi:hypothetical protein